MRHLPLLLLLVAVLPAGPARAQNRNPAAPAPRAVDTFARLFPKPDGQNGYEELVLASDLVANNQDFTRIEAENTTLTFQRAVLREPSIQRALTLIRRGLAKGTLSPRAEVHVDTLLPELAQFRRVARLLKVLVRVQMADGQTADAIETVRLGLRFARATDTDTLISSLVAAAIDAICTSAIADHLGQLSARDCEALYRLCLEWLRLPDPTLHALDMERQNARVMIEDLKRQTPSQWIQNLGLQNDAFAQAELRRITAEPGAADAIFDEAGRRLARCFEQALREVQKPVWQRDWAPDPAPTDPAGYLFGFLKPPLSHVSDGFARDQARLRLLACHCAIRRYRWEHDRLPDSLAVLQLGDLAVDPFSGLPLLYTASGSDYRLVSVGAPAPADDPQAVNGRRPLSVISGE